MTEVVPIRPGVATPQSASEDNALIIEYLETTLEEARSGQVESIGIAIVLKNDIVRSRFHFGTGSWKLFGAAAVLQQHLSEALGNISRDE